MTTLSPKELLQFNRLGLIPGPDETVSEFSLRAAYCLSLKEHLSDELTLHLGEAADNPLSFYREGFFKIDSLYDCSPKWIPIFFSNYQLAPWHGGCAWIFQMKEDLPTAALLQLKKSLGQKQKRFYLYHPDELIAHELAHACRMKFEEPIFEEIIAYSTSASPLRRWLGPIANSSFESMLFVLLLGMIFLIDLFLLFFASYSFYLSAMWLKMIPVVMIAYAVIRLQYRHRQFNLCFKNLVLWLKCEKHARGVIFRLTDKEINDFSKISIEKIREYAEAKTHDSLRWKVIHEAYIKHN